GYRILQKLLLIFRIRESFRRTSFFELLRLKPRTTDFALLFLLFSADFYLQYSTLFVYHNDKIFLLDKCQNRYLFPETTFLPFGANLYTPYFLRFLDYMLHILLPDNLPSIFFHQGPTLTR